MEQQENGFTLIEVLIVVSILGILGTAITNMFLAGWESSQYNQQQLSLKTEERVILNRLKQELIRSREVDTKDGSELLIKITNDSDKVPEKCLKYNVEDHIFKMWQTDVTSYTEQEGKWPDTDPNSSWGSAIELTQDIVVAANYVYQPDENIVQIDISLTGDDDFSEADYRIQEQVFLRLLDLKRGD